MTIVEALIKRGRTCSAIIVGGAFLAVGSCWAADPLPKGIYVQGIGGLSEAMSAMVMDNNPMFQILDGNQVGNVPGSLNKIIGTPFAGVGAGVGLTRYLRVGGAFMYHTGFDLHDHDQHFATGTGGTPLDFGSTTAFDGQIHARSYTGDAAYYFPAGSLHPYINGGAGLATVITDRAQVQYNGVSTSIIGQSQNNRTYHIGGGISVAAGSHAAIDLGYQYTDLGNIKYPAQTFIGNFGPQQLSGFTGRLKTNEFIASVRFHFGK